MKVLILIPFLIYLLILFTFSYFTNRKTSQDLTGFFLGDRNVSPYTSAVSAAISGRGAWLLFGVTAQAYINGLSAIWLIVGFLISEFFLFVFLAPQVRKFTGINSSVTFIDMFASRYKDETISLRIVLSIVLIFFSLSFIAAQFMGGGIAFFAFLGISNTHGIIITGVIVLLLVLIGGYKSLNDTDVLNALLILFVLTIMPVIVLFRNEGIDVIHSELLKANSSFFDFGALSTGTLIGFLSLGLSSSGNTGILLKYIALRDSEKFPQLAVITTLVSLLMTVAALFTGISARIYFPTPDSIPGADAQNVFIGLTGAILHPLLIGLVLCSIFGSLLSSAGSNILVAGSSLVIDIYEKTISRGKSISQDKLRYISSIAIVILAYIAIIAGALLDTSFYGFVLFALAGLGASFGPAILLTFFWSESTSNGVKAGVITGALTVIFWKSIPGLSENLYELIPGFILSVLAIWWGSKIDRRIVLNRLYKTAKYEDIKKTNFSE